MLNTCPRTVFNFYETMRKPWVMMLPLALSLTTPAHTADPLQLTSVTGASRLNCISLYNARHVAMTTKIQPRKITSQNVNFVQTSVYSVWTVADIADWLTLFYNTMMTALQGMIKNSDLIWNRCPCTHCIFWSSPSLLRLRCNCVLYCGAFLWRSHLDGRISVLKI